MVGLAGIGSRLSLADDEDVGVGSDRPTVKK